MKVGLTIFGLLFWVFTSREALSQQKLDKDEILNEYRTFQSTPSLDSVFRWEIHLGTRATLDNLFNTGVDTLVVYSISFPGSVYKAKHDSCSTLYPTNSYFFWKKNGKYFFTETDGRCKFRDSGVDGKVVKFAVNNYPKIDDEFFMEAVSGAERNGEYLRVSESSVAHEPKYLILIVVGDHYNYLTFTESGLTNESSLFLDYNKGLNSFKLFELIKTQIKND